MSDTTSSKSKRMRNKAVGNINWTEEGWRDYLFWQESDRKKCKKINKLITAILRNPHDGEGKPEPLTHQLSGYWSRRIDQEHRLVYKYDEQSETVTILQCRYHYDK